MDMDKERTKNCVIFLISLLFFWILAYLFPYVGDDWAWGSSIGIRRLENWFQNYNGRYGGNLLVLLLTRHRFLRAFVMGISYSGICWLCNRYAGDRGSVSLLLSLVLFLCMPKEMVRETIAWTAGYSNYVLSALISLFFILHGSRRIEGHYRETSGLMNASVFLLAFLGGLFMEHITIFHIVWSIGLLIWEKKRFGKLFSLEIWMLAGAVLAAVCMFSNPLYWNVLLGKKAYQGVAHTLPSLLYLIGSNGLRCLKSLVIDNSILCCIITVLLAIFYFQRKDTCSREQIRRLDWALAVNVACQAMIVGLRIVPDRWIWIIQGFFAICYVISLVVILHICAEKTRRKQLLLPLACMMAVSVPLLVVSPIGPRCFFLAYLLLMVFLLELFDCIRSKWKTENRKPGLVTGILCLVLLFQMGAFMGVYHAIYRYEQLRAEHCITQSAAGKKRITVCSLPFAKYVHMPHLGEGRWNQRFILFYGLNDDTELDVISPEEFDHLILNAEAAP